ncbi:UNVERIFIED_CONTAM: hypothetical protein Slati_2668800 [Sesamum latifolium]|uniref:CCHC-type domain-containing protein n=1 Tax=Sesamum latifolium TaxID=2727402 RepID=A0AAW2VV47_9LAMI
MLVSQSPFQVHIHGLPIRMMTRDVVEAIGARLGTVIECAPNQAQLGWESKIRMKVSLDVRKPLKRGFCLRSPGGEQLMVSFTYEKLPTFCYECGVLGHIMRDCELRLEKLDKGKEGGELQYGAWLREIRGVGQFNRAGAGVWCWAAGEPRGGRGYHLNSKGGGRRGPAIFYNGNRGLGRDWSHSAEEDGGTNDRRSSVASEPRPTAADF